MFLEPQRLPILSNSYSNQADFSKMKTISQLIYIIKNPTKEGNIDNDAAINSTLFKQETQLHTYCRYTRTVIKLYYHQNSKIKTNHYS